MEEGDLYAEGKNLWTAASDGDSARVQDLLQSGCSVNEQDEYGYTALQAAVSYEHTPLVEMLLHLGADPNLADADGDTPLHLCEKTEIAERLIAAGANPQVTNSEGKTPLDVHREDEVDEMVDFFESLGGFQADNIET